MASSTKGRAPHKVSLNPPLARRAPHTPHKAFAGIASRAKGGPQRKDTWLSTPAGPVNATPFPPQCALTSCAATPNVNARDVRHAHLLAACDPQQSQTTNSATPNAYGKASTQTQLITAKECANPATILKPKPNQLPDMRAYGQGESQHTQPACSNQQERVGEPPPPPPFDYG